jgi:uracil-DNA glycosylase
MTADVPIDDHERQRRYYLEVMGIQCWQSLEKDMLPVAEPVVAMSAATVLGTGSDQSAESSTTALQQLYRDVSQCQRCDLHAGRTQAITGRGLVTAGLMLVSLAPDSRDDAAGEICSGEAGELLAKMLSAIELSIDDVYITSLLKCSVPSQHTVTTSELHHCKKYLQQQIALIQPSLLLVMGEVAARCLLQMDAPLDDLRNEVNGGLTAGTLVDAGDSNAVHQFESTPLFVSYSPQELVQQPASKRKAWHDLQQLQQLIKA